MPDCEVLLERPLCLQGNGIAQIGSTVSNVLDSGQHLTFLVSPESICCYEATLFQIVHLKPVRTIHVHGMTDISI